MKNQNFLRQLRVADGMWMSKTMKKHLEKNYRQWTHFRNNKLFKRYMEDGGL